MDEHQRNAVSGDISCQCVSIYYVIMPIHFSAFMESILAVCCCTLLEL